MSAVIKDLARAAALAAAPTVRLVRGDTVTLEPVRWLWPGFLPAAMLTILGGAPGCGKTTIALSRTLAPEPVVTQRWRGLRLFLGRICTHVNCDNLA